MKSVNSYPGQRAIVNGAATFGIAEMSRNGRPETSGESASMEPRTQSRGNVSLIGYQARRRDGGCAEAVKVVTALLRFVKGLWFRALGQRGPVPSEHGGLETTSIVVSVVFASVLL
jgi:hypothetical protein